MDLIVAHIYQRYVWCKGRYGADFLTIHRVDLHTELMRLAMEDRTENERKGTESGGGEGKGLTQKPT